VRHLSYENSQVGLHSRRQTDVPLRKAYIRLATNVATVR